MISRSIRSKRDHNTTSNINRVRSYGNSTVTKKSTSTIWYSYIHILRKISTINKKQFSSEILGYVFFSFFKRKRKNMFYDISLFHISWSLHTVFSLNWPLYFKLRGYKSRFNRRRSYEMRKYRQWTRRRIVEVYEIDPVRAHPPRKKRTKESPSDKGEKSAVSSNR